jgi:hypothetical protein
VILAARAVILCASTLSVLIVGVALDVSVLTLCVILLFVSVCVPVNVTSQATIFQDHKRLSLLIVLMVVPDTSVSCFAFNAVCVALLTGLFASLVLSTFHRPKFVLAVA